MSRELGFCILFIVFILCGDSTYQCQTMDTEFPSDEYCFDFNGYPFGLLDFDATSDNLILPSVDYMAFIVLDPILSDNKFSFKLGFFHEGKKKASSLYDFHIEQNRMYSDTININGMNIFLYLSDSKIQFQKSGTSFIQVFPSSKQTSSLNLASYYSLDKDGTVYSVRFLKYVQIINGQQYPVYFATSGTPFYFLNYGDYLIGFDKQFLFYGTAVFIFV